MMERNEAESVIKDTIEYANSEIKKNQVKNRKTIIGLISVIVCLLLVASFFAGSYWREKKQSDVRLQRCCHFISFAIDKAENDDLSDSSTVKALISNVYAAYESCDDEIPKEQLHQLWNLLVHATDGGEDDIRLIALNELNAVLKCIKPAD